MTETIAKEQKKGKKVIAGNGLLAPQVEGDYFGYINETNAYHTAHVLKKIVKSKPENFKYVCLVVSYVEPDISERLIEEFPDGLKAKIVAEIMSLIQYSKAEIESFDKILRRLLTEQFGGKLVLAKILEELDLEEKLEIHNAFQNKYPDTAADFRSVMILFEDLFSVEDKNFHRIFTEIPSEVLSIAFCNQSEDRINKLYDILPKGVKAIVEQGIDLGKTKYSKTEINKAQQYIIEFSKNLERDGFIGPILGDVAVPKESAEEEYI